MGSEAPQPVDAQQPTLLPRWRDVILGTWRAWSPFIPPVLLLIGLLLHIKVNDLVGTVIQFAFYAFYGWLLIPPMWSIIKANPGILRMRWLRFMFAGAALAIAAIVGLGITYIITASTVGIAQTTLIVLAFVGFATVFVAPFGGLLGASKHVIERYRASH